MNRTLRVKVIPRSARSEVSGELADGVLKVKIAAPPERGKANEELCRVLAEHYGVPKSAVSILSGQTASLKLVRIESPPTYGLGRPPRRGKSWDERRHTKWLLSTGPNAPLWKACRID